MKSFILFITVLLFIELAHAAHIAAIYRHRQYKRTPTIKPPVRRLLKKRGNTCTPHTSNNTTTTPNANTPSTSNSSTPTTPNANNTTTPNGNNTSTPNCNSTSTPDGNGHTGPPKSPPNNSTTGSTGGFPSLGFKMPSSVPSSLSGWWSDYTSEIGFLGFSYAVDACQSPQTLQSDFQNIRKQFNGRYVRLYGACDQDGFYDSIVDAAWDAGIGVHALIWFGFDGDNMWMTRRDSLFSTLHSNPKAKFVTRAVQFGSEPLFDHVLSADDLAAQVIAAKQNLSPLGILVTVSDMAYGYQSSGGAQSVLGAVDFADLHMLPFFSTTATTASDSWGFVQNDLDWMNSHLNGKKIILSENGWPSMQSGSTRSSSPTAVADVQQEQDYFDLLDSKCQDLKKNPGGGVGWFAHLYSEDQGAGYGILDNGQLKFPFSPKTSC